MGIYDFGFTSPFIPLQRGIKRCPPLGGCRGNCPPAGGGAGGGP